MSIPGRADAASRTPTSAEASPDPTPPDPTSFGLACRRGGAGPMSVAHRHDDLEFNLAPTSLAYLVDGRPVEIPAGRLAVFWAARPHRLTRPADDVTWLTVPLGLALAWSLPAAFLQRLLAGDVLLVEGDGALALDRRAEEWAPGLGTAAPGSDRRATELEIEAFAVRVAGRGAATVARREGAASARSFAGAPRDAAAAMAAFVSKHADDDLRVDDVARHVHLHPQYAMTVFRRSLGITVGEYLLQCRIARAQHLLLTTSMPVPEVGFAAGFRSQSQFYARFRERCGEPPAAYRRRFSVG